MKSKRIIAWLCTIAMLGSIGVIDDLSIINNQNNAVSAEWDEGFTYSVSDEGICIDGYTGNETDIIIPSEIEGISVTSIASKAFYGRNDLKSIKIPDSVTNIGKSAFAGCTGLRKIALPKFITRIEEGLFYYCEGLTDVTIPDSVTSIGEEAFGVCTVLRNITIPNSVTNIENGAFSDCECLNSIIIPDSVTNIGDSAFKGCTLLMNVTILDSVASIGTSIGDYAFYRCVNLENVTIPNSVTSIGVEAFECCFSLKNITIPNSVTSIGNSAFHYCFGLESVIISNSATYVGDSAFGDCQSLKSVTAPCTLSASSGLNNVNYTHDFKEYISDNNSTCASRGTMTAKCENCDETDTITDIGSATGHTEVIDLEVPATCTEPGKTEGSHCSVCGEIFVKQQDIPVHHTDSDRNGLCDKCKIYLGHTDSDSDNKCDICEGIYLDESDYIFSDGVITGITEEGKNKHFAVIPSSINGETVVKIGDYAFSECSNLVSAVIPDTVTEIGDYAFYCCFDLSEISISENVQSIGEWAFSCCLSLKTITLPKSMTVISEALLYGCSDLTEVKIQGQVTDICDWAFSSCSSLKELSLPESVENIGMFVFDDCNKLASLTLPCSLRRNSSVRDANKNYKTKLTLLHVKVIDSEKAPGCIEPGLTEGFHCACGQLYEAQEEIPALGQHVEVKDEAKSATCTEAGLTEGSHCSVCDEVIIEQQEIPAPGHTEVIEEGKDATCTEPGKTEGKHCSVCGEILAKQEVTEPLGHTVVTDSEIPATCTEPGKTEGKHCSVCGEILAKQEVTEPLGHTEVTDSEIPATCTDPGKTEGKHCSVCGEVIEVQEDIPATGHNYENGKCTACGESAPSSNKIVFNNDFVYGQKYDLKDYNCTNISGLKIKFRNNVPADFSGMVVLGNYVFNAGISNSTCSDNSYEVSFNNLNFWNIPDTLTVYKWWGEDPVIEEIEFIYSEETAPETPENSVVIESENNHFDISDYNSSDIKSISIVLKDVVYNGGGQIVFDNWSTSSFNINRSCGKVITVDVANTSGSFNVNFWDNSSEIEKIVLNY